MTDLFGNEVSDEHQDVQAQAGEVPGAAELPALRVDKEVTVRHLRHHCRRWDAGEQEVSKVRAGKRGLHVQRRAPISASRWVCDAWEKTEEAQG